MTLGEAIEELIRQYDKACGMDRVKCPLTYALYRVYEQADKETRAEVVDKWLDLAMADKETRDAKR